MHVCFHGGGGGRLAKSFNVISDFTKILIGRRGVSTRGRRSAGGRTTYDRIAELYCLVKPDDDDEEEEAIAAAEAAMLPATPCQSEAEDDDDDDDDGAAGAESSSRSPSTSTFSGGPSSGSGGGSTGTLGSPILGLVTAPNTTGGGEHDAVRDQHQPTAATWREWVEEYEPGVFITVGAYPGHRLQLRCVELSREKFGEVKARVWWEENKARLHHLYSF
uniref:BRX domain-containing protein n=1 Tax=Oryza barthii TaxID=65489 RepID=A0A0D3HS85_9ORYZ